MRLSGEAVARQRACKAEMRESYCRWQAREIKCGAKARGANLARCNAGTCRRRLHARALQRLGQSHDSSPHMPLGRLEPNHKLLQNDQNEFKFVGPVDLGAPAMQCRSRTFAVTGAQQDLLEALFLTPASPPRLNSGKKNYLLSTIQPQ